MFVSLTKIIYHPRLLFQFSDISSGDGRIKSKSVKQQKICELKDSYSRNFTIHGVSRIIHGKPVECIFWFILVAGIISVVLYSCNTYYSKYTNNEFRIENRAKTLNEITLPAIIICQNIRDSLKCFNEKPLLETNKGFSCSKSSKTYSILFDKSCQECSDHIRSDINSSKNVTFPGCTRVNMKGLISQRVKSEYPIEFSVKLINQEECTPLSLFIEDQTFIKGSSDVIYYSQLPSNVKLCKYNNPLVIGFKQKTYVKRLPTPYSSDCTFGEGIENFFSTYYSQSSCIQSCFLREMFNNCGTVIDRWKPFLTKDMRLKLNEGVNSTDCLSHYIGLFFKYDIPKTCFCPSACVETEFKTQVYKGTGYLVPGLQFRIRYTSKKVMYIEEIPSYTFFDFLAEMGGVVGVSVGMSVVSVLEIVIYCTLCFIGAISK